MSREVLLSTFLFTKNRYNVIVGSSLYKIKKYLLEFRTRKASVIIYRENRKNGKLGDSIPFNVVIRLNSFYLIYIVWIAVAIYWTK